MRISRRYRVRDLTGQVFGKLTAISYHSTDRLGALWNCVCECGNTKIIRSSYLVQKETKSCGCYNVERIIARSTTHGQSHTREHSSWMNMRQRCHDPNAISYKNYGGRGIKVCDRWLNSFENFILDMGHAPSQKHSIERIRVNENYEPSNCRWATSVEQNNNRRSNRIITYNGESKTLAQWVEKFNLNYSKLWYRLEKGWNLDRAFQTP